MKHIKHYKIFENKGPNFPTTREEVIEVCRKYDIRNYSINDDLSIDISGGVFLDRKKLEYLPVRFNYVSGDFTCCGNGLRSLEGCPQTVDSHFYCYDNELKTLEGSPLTVGGDFSCSWNDLKTLKGCPSVVNGNFNCFGNELKSLEGCPSVVNGNFNCSHNKLADLEHFPEVSGNIDIRHNTVNLLVYTFINKADSFMIEDFVDYEIVRNSDTVMLDRLQTFIRDNDLEMPDLEKIKEHYKIIE
jgi:hypothetical protein